MVAIVSAFALMFAVVALVLLGLAVRGLRGRWRGRGRWRRIEASIVGIEERAHVTTATTSRRGSGPSSRSIVERVFIPVLEFRGVDGAPARMESPLVSADPGRFRIGDRVELLVDPAGEVEPLVDARGGIWFVPVSMALAGLVAGGVAAVLVYMILHR